jgi:hypothetical protein
VRLPRDVSLPLSPFGQPKATSKQPAGPLTCIIPLSTSSGGVGCSRIHDMSPSQSPATYIGCGRPGHQKSPSAEDRRAAVDACWVRAFPPPGRFPVAELDRGPRKAPVRRNNLTSDEWSGSRQNRAASPLLASCVPRCRPYSHCNQSIYIAPSRVSKLDTQRGIRHAVAHHDCSCVIRSAKG